MSRRRLRETPGSRTRAVCERLAALDLVELVSGDRPPEGVDDPRRRARDVRLLALEMLAPETWACFPRHFFVMGDDVHFGVVQERVGVQVGGADGEPAVVDDPDLRVHVDDVAQLCFARVDGAGEEALVVAVCRDEGCDLAARDVGAVVGSGREEHDEAEVVGWWVLDLVDQDLDDLG